MQPGLCKPQDYFSLQLFGLGEQLVKHRPGVQMAICRRPGCGKGTWNGRRNEFCGRECPRLVALAEPSAMHLLAQQAEDEHESEKL